MGYFSFSFQLLSTYATAFLDLKFWNRESVCYANVATAIYARQKMFCKNSFQAGMDFQKYRNKTGMKTCKKLPYYKAMADIKDKKPTLYLLRADVG